jgi:hypothetical protein
VAKMTVLIKLLCTIFIWVQLKEKDMKKLSQTIYIQ